MENFEEKTCLCALNRIFGFAPKTGLALIAHMGSATNVFNLDEKELDTLMGPYSKYKGKINRQAFESAAKEIDTLKARGIQFCGFTEGSYPSLLKECEDAPIGLYIRSDTPVSQLWHQPALAVVGTRNITPYGKEWCDRIIRGLSSTTARPSIISGLALGVDIEAHKTALESGLPTIAVMATGPEEVYPYRHRGFADRLASTPGCALVTDYPPGTAPLPIHFLRRNRIIAGLSGSTVLIESKIRGGGLMTCRLAFSYNRDVYALPGRVDDIYSQGCNELIRKKIAEPLTSVSALTDALGLNCKGSVHELDDKGMVDRLYRERCTEEDIRLMESIITVIRKTRGITIEEVAEETNISYRKAAELTILLELDGIITTDLMQRCSINPKFM